MMVGDGRFGIVSDTDTLALSEFSKNSFMLVNQVNGDIYTTMAIREKNGFIVFVTPVRNNSPHATHSLTLSTTNICNKKHNNGKD